MGLSFLALVVFTGLSIAYLAIDAIDRQLWMDDTHSTYHAFFGPGGVIESLRTDSHPPLYFILLSFWISLGGLGEVWLRLPSLACILAAGFVLFRYGAREENARLGWTFAVFFLGNPVAVMHMQTVRPYALAGAFAAMSTVLYLRLADDDSRLSRSELLAYVAVNALGTLTHYWFFLLLAAQGLGTLLFARGLVRWRHVAALAASVVPFAVLWGPTFLAQTAGAPTSWMPRPGGWWLARAPGQLFGGNTFYDFRSWSERYMALVILGAFVRFDPKLRRTKIPELTGVFLDRRLWMAALIPVVVITLAYFISQVRPIFHPKYTIVATPAVAITLGLFVAKGLDRRVWPIACAVFVAAHVAVRRESLAMEVSRDNRAATAYLLDRLQPSDDILHISLNYAPTLHYLRVMAPGREFSHWIFPGEVANHVGWRDALASDTTALRKEAVQLSQELLARGNRVWFLAYFLEDPEHTAILTEELEARFRLVHNEPIRGWWIDEIRLYEPK